MHAAETSTTAVLGVTLLALLATGDARADDAIVIGEGHVLHSDVLEEDRHLRIHVPEHDDDSVFPVLVVLDAEDNFASVVGMVPQLVRGEVLPELIVVGVDNTYRMWHSTTAWEEFQGPPSGGAVDFSTFLADEMLPYIKANYPAADHRTIIGHSIGGVLLNYLLASHPQLFQGYVSVSPSTWWHDGEFDERLSEAWTNAGRVPERDTALYLSLADEDALPHASSSSGMRAAFHELSAFLRHAAPETLHWTAEHFPNENHITSYLPAVQRGLRHVFDGWDMQHFYDSGDIDGLKAHLQSLTNRIGFNVTPTAMMELAGMGRSATRAGDPARAVEILAWGVEFFPDSIAMNNFLGEAHEAREEYDQALSVYRHSLRTAEAKGSPMVRWINRRIEAVQEAKQAAASH